MDPVSLGALATASIVSSGVGSAVAAGGAIYSGIAGYEANKYQAGIASMNAKIERQNAEYSRAVGEAKAEESGIQARQREGAIKAAQGASGFSIEGGSATSVRSSQKDTDIYEESVIRSNYAKAAYGHETQALNFDAQASLDRMAARNSLVSGAVNATTSIIGGATNVADKWLKYSSIFMG
jgi:hypothetical protein